jgi:hypothetical protein
MKRLSLNSDGAFRTTIHKRTPQAKNNTSTVYFFIIIVVVVVDYSNNSTSSRKKRNVLEINKISSHENYAISSYVL